MIASKKPTAGTYVLSGIIQGKVVVEPDFLEMWTKEAAKKGLHFSLRIDANDFSLLPSETPKSTTILGEIPLDEIVCERVGSLIGLFDSPSEGQIFSTLRSEEFKFGRAEQTIYKIGQNGKVESESREVEIETEEPPPELTSGGKLKLALITVGVIALVFLATTPFVNYKAMFQEAKDKVTTLKAEEVEVDTKKLSKAVTISVKEVIPKESTIVLSVKKGDRWKELYESTPQTEFANWEDFSIAKSLHNRLRCEWFDRHGNLLMISFLELKDFKEKDSFEEKVKIKTKGKIHTLKILPD